MLLQQGAIFLIKRHLAVMLLLVADVLRDNSGIRNAYTESAIAFLPGKSAAVLIHPLGGVRLEELDGLGQRHILRQMKQYMSVVRHAVDGNRSHSLIAADTRHVRPQLRLDGFGDGWPAVLCTEDEMDVVFDERVGHELMSPFQGLHSIAPLPTTYVVGSIILPRQCRGWIVGSSPPGSTAFDFLSKQT
jgi:hypothetical protein